MRRNNKWRREKEYRKIQEELCGTYATRRKHREEREETTWIELEKPEPYGWKGYLSVRGDVAVRIDRDGLEEALTTCSYTAHTWTRNRYDAIRNIYERLQGHYLRRLVYNEYTMLISNLRLLTHKLLPNEYERMSEGAKVWFKRQTVTEYEKRTEYALRKIDHYYSCSIPNYWLVLRFKRLYKTHYGIRNGEVFARESYLERRLQYRFYNEYYRRGHRWDTWFGNRKSYEKQKSSYRTEIDYLEDYVNYWYDGEWGTSDDCYTKAQAIALLKRKL